MSLELSYAQLHFMSSADVKKFLNCHIKTAQQKLKKIREVLGRKPNSPITIQEYADFEGIPVSILESFKQWQYN